MSIVCYRDGVMASDSSVICDELIVGRAKKIVRSRDGVLAGATGRLSTCERFLDWASSFPWHQAPHLPIPHFPGASKLGSFNGIVVMPGGRVIEYTPDGEPITIIREDFWAFGIADAVAIGAMAAGASAEQAVRICCERSRSIGGEVTVLYLDDAKQIAHEREQGRPPSFSLDIPKGEDWRSRA